MPMCQGTLFEAEHTELHLLLMAMVAHNQWNTVGDDASVQRGHINNYGSCVMDVFQLHV